VLACDENRGMFQTVKPRFGPIEDESSSQARGKSVLDGGFEMNMFIAVATVSSLAGGALAQDFEIALVAPMTVGMGETYTVEAWGSVTGDPWVDGTSAMAGFGFDVIGSGNAASISTATFPLWSRGFSVEGTVDGISVHGVSGGQLANLFGTLNPNLSLSNPILLFTVEVTAAEMRGVITYTPENLNINGGLSFYPDSTDGVSIIAPNDPGTTLTLAGVTTRVVPAPATLGLIGLTGLAAGRRREATLKTDG
jgi:hypothetical protein